MSNLYIVNHKYHIEYLKADLIDGDTLVIISNTTYTFSNSKINTYYLPFFESLSVIKKAIFRVLLLYHIPIILMKEKNITLIGCQDIISYKIYKVAQFIRYFRGGKIQVVPDNIEFYLRYIPAQKHTSLRLIMKALLFGCCISLLRGKVHHMLGHFTFVISADITEPIYVKPIIFLNSDSNAAFISQPYYLDYSLNLNDWIETPHSKLTELKCTYILFHPRDSTEFYTTMLELGYKPASHSVEYNEYYGIFSTYMSSLHVMNKPVKSILKDFTSILPTEYVNIVNLLITYGKMKGLDFGFNIIE